MLYVAAIFVLGANMPAIDGEGIGTMLIAATGFALLAMVMAPLVIREPLPRPGRILLGVSVLAVTAFAATVRLL